MCYCMYVARVSKFAFQVSTFLYISLVGNIKLLEWFSVGFRVGFIEEIHFNI